MTNHCTRCGSNYSCRLSKGQLAFVVNEDNLAQALFSQLRISDASLCAWLQAGEAVCLLRGPCFHRSMYMWKVKSLKSNRVGWTSAGTGAEKFMLPLPVRRLCESALPSRLHIGDIAGIENASLRPLALLRTPVPFKAGGTPVGTIFASSRLTIMDGPFCYCDGKYGQIFWHVCSENGLEGWVAECDHESYQLKPLTIRCRGYGCKLLSPVVWKASNFG